MKTLTEAIFRLAPPGGFFDETVVRNLFANALFQQGPWQGRRIEVTPDWFIAALKEKIESIDWPTARDDVRRFLPLAEQRGLESWDTGFFLYHIDSIARYMANTR